MKPAISIVALAAFAAPFASSCKKVEKNTNDNLQPAVVTQPGMASDAQAAAHAPTQGKGMAAEGKVAETMNAGGYTYVLVESAKGQLWAAAPETAVKVGDQVSFVSGMPMAQFRSNTLDRTFEMVYFVPGLTINGAVVAPVAKTPATGAGAEPAAMEIKDIKKAKGGKTVAELFASKSEMSGKSVSIRGKVVKYNGGIMGSNWLHIQDGSGAAGSNDLTITTKAVAKVGDIVLIKGVVGLDKNFGGGYKYGLIVEDAAITVE
jgi:hypothetical protein